MDISLVWSDHPHPDCWIGAHGCKTTACRSAVGNARPWAQDLRGASELDLETTLQDRQHLAPLLAQREVVDRRARGQTALKQLNWFVIAC